MPRTSFERGEMELCTVYAESNVAKLGKISTFRSSGSDDVIFRAHIWVKDASHSLELKDARGMVHQLKKFDNVSGDNITVLSSSKDSVNHPCSKRAMLSVWTSNSRAFILSKHPQF